MEISPVLTAKETLARWGSAVRVFLDGKDITNDTVEVNPLEGWAQTVIRLNDGCILFDEEDMEPRIEVLYGNISVTIGGK